MGFIQNVRDLFISRAHQPTPTIESPRNIVAGVNDGVGQQSGTFDNRNITFTGDLENYDFEAILRDKQHNMNRLYQLSDYYVDKDPIYRGIILGVYTPFSVSDWKLIGASEKIKEKYQEYYKRIHLRDFMWSVFLQYYKYGNVYCYLMEDGSLITLPVHKVRISNVTINGEPVIEYNAGSLLTDKENVGQVADKPYIKDDEIKIRLNGYPPEVSDAINNRKEWVQLNPENTFVLQGMKEDWVRYSVPMIASCLTALKKKETIQKYENASLNMGIHSFFHVRYGDVDSNKDFLPNREELTALDSLFKRAMTGNSLATTNCLVDAKVVQADTKDLFQYDKYNEVNAELLSAGGISGIIVSGRAEDGSSYASAQVSIKTAAARIRQVRDNFCEMINKVNLRLNGSTLTHSSPAKIPRFEFPPVDLAGDSSFLETCSSLWHDGLVSTKTLLEANGIDIGQEVERRKNEASDGTDDTLVSRDEKGEAQSTSSEADGPNNGKIGRPEMDDDERTSDPSKSLEGKQPKPSNPDGSM